MITDTLSNIISRDKTCLLGLAKLDKSKYLYSIAPLNENSVYSKVVAQIDNSYDELKPLEILGEWSAESNIYFPSSCFLYNSLDNYDLDEPKNKVYSTNDWLIKTSLNLPKEIDENNLDLIKSDFSFLSFMKLKSENAQKIDNVTIEWEEEVVINENPYTTEMVTRSETIDISRDDILSGYVSNGTLRSNAIKNKVDELIEASKIQIFKQGGIDLNGVFDVSAKIFQDSNGYFGEIIITVYYYPVNGGSVLKHIMITNFTDASSLLDKFHLFLITIDSSNGYISLYMDDEMLREDALDLTIIENPILNYPISNQLDDYQFIIGGFGASKFELANIFIFDRILTLPEALFFDKIIAKNID